MKQLFLFTVSAVLVMLLAPGSALASKEEGGKPQKDANFEQAKANKIQGLKALLACYEQAQSKEAMKSCREQSSKKRDMQERERKLQKIQEHKKKLEEEEKKLQSDSHGK